MNSQSLIKNAIAILTLSLSVCTLSATKIEETVVHQIPATSLSKLDLSNINGSITCTGVESDIVELTCNLKVKAGSEEAAKSYMDKINIDIIQDGDQLKVQTKYPKNKNGFWNWISRNGTSASVEYLITVPKSLEVKLESVNGSITASELGGKTHLETVNGGIKAEALSAPAKAETVNGSIHCEFTENATLSDMKFETVNGSIKVKLPKDSAFYLTVETVNGGINCDFDLPSDASKGRRSLKANINGGGPHLSFETVNGSVGVGQN